MQNAFSSLCAFPLRCEWDTLHPPAPKSHPVPLRTSREPAPAGRPGPVFELEALALSRGWMVAVTYAIGWVPGQRRSEPQESWAIRCARGTRRAVAVYRSGSWASLWTWSDTEFFVRAPILELFKGALR